MIKRFKGDNEKMKKQVVGLIALVLFIVSMFSSLPSLQVYAGTTNAPEQLSIDELNQLINIADSQRGNMLQALGDSTGYISDTLDLGEILINNQIGYEQIYQPWKSKAAVRVVTVSDDKEYVAVGGGYLYDNEVHLYRWNPDIGQYSKVWDCGDSIIKKDVVDIDFGDTDNNDFMEIVAASLDGHFYVFEQKHIYDPDTNTENMFGHVYTSPYLGPVYAVEVNDTDYDHLQDIIVASWDQRVHIFEYYEHSSYPFATSHWITYKEKWQSEILGQLPTSLVVGDTNYNGLLDIIIGTREGGLFVYENNGTVLDIHGAPYPLPQDNSYKRIFADSSYMTKPIYSMAISNLDGVPGDEVVIAEFAHNAHILRYDFTSKEYYFEKLIKDFEDWTLKDFYPADYYIDNATAGQNVYLGSRGTHVPEPVTEDYWMYMEIYPYFTGTAQNGTDASTLFLANQTHSAWEVFDFGVDEEATGNGNSKKDFAIVCNMTSITKDLLNNITIQISPDHKRWAEVELSYSDNVDSYMGYPSLLIDVDPYLIKNKWDYFRYVNVTVDADSIPFYTFYMEMFYPFKTVSSATCASIGLLNDKSTTSVHALIGTVEGSINAFKYDSDQDEFVLVWDSWVDDRFSMGSNIWDIEQIGQNTGNMPVLVGLTDLGTNYMSTSEPSIHLPPGAEVFDYDFWDIDLDPYQYGDYIISTNEGKVYFFQQSLSSYNATLTAQMFDEINLPSNPWSGLNISVSLVELKTSWIGPEIIIGWYNETAIDLYDDYLQEGTTEPPGGFAVFGRSGSGKEYIEQTPLSYSDFNPDLKMHQLLMSLSSTPSVDGVDVDSDGDTDLVVEINGDLYMFWNTGDPDVCTLILEEGYFDDINNARGSRSYFSPQFVDFDLDGDIDVVTGYSNRVGATYFENYGTLTNAKWEEKKELLNNLDEEATINVYNLTRPLFISALDNGEYFTLLLSKVLGQDMYDKYIYYHMLNVFTNEVYTFAIDYQVQDSFIVATNPVISKVEINSFKSKLVNEVYKYRNFGFRAIESWSTRYELQNWTMTVKAGDLDGDGNGEFIVGDFDNNLYIFEHMTNNTYKRAYRSPDMKQYVPTNSTPYAHEQLGGIKGQFNQTIWNHVSHIVVHTDVNNNGYPEIIALAGTVFYVFEVTDIDDTYELIYRYDVLRSSAGAYLMQHEYLDPTALAYAKDLDHDGYSEIIVGFEKQLFVYEPYTADFYELFGVVGISTGHYNLPGNSQIYSNLTISGVTVGDTNKNGVEEIIIYGHTGMDYWYPRGFLAIIESNNGLGYKVIWEAPTDILKDNHIYTVEIDDQDYDGNLELIIGGEKGVSIFEFNGTTDLTTYKNVGTITGHMNYPFMPSNPVLGKSSLYTSDGQIRFRDHDIIQLTNNPENNHSYLSVWTEYDSGDGKYRLFQASSHDGENWNSKVKLPALPSGYDHDMLSPSMVQIEQTSPSAPGRIYVAWTQFYDDTPTAMGTSYIFMVFCMYSDDLGETWTLGNSLGLHAVYTGSNYLNNPIRSPTILADGYTGIHYAYILQNTTVHNTTIFYGSYTGSGSADGPYYLEGLEDYYINGIDGCAKPDGSDTYAFAMSAKRTVEEATDYDIWFFELNSTMQFSIDPRKVVKSATVEHTPSIAYLINDKYPLLITYDAAAVDVPYTSSYGIVSEDYQYWSEPDLIGVFPSYVQKHPYYDALYLLDGSDPSKWRFHDIQLRGPKVTATYDGKFALLTKLDMRGFYFSMSSWVTRFLEDLLCQIYEYNSTSFTALSSAKHIAVGDSDQDGLREIYVGDGHYTRLYELYSSSPDALLYQTAWTSKKYENKVSGVAIYDTNGNGFPELLTSVQGEDVYLYEINDIDVPRADLEVEIEYASPMVLPNYDYQKIVGRNTKVIAKTVVMNDFLDLGYEQLFFIENKTLAYLYDPQTQNILYNYIIPTNGTKVLGAVGADVLGSGYKQSIYYITDNHEYGLLNIEQGINQTYVKEDLSSTAYEILDLAATKYDGSNKEELVLLFKNINGYIVSTYGPDDGTERWRVIYNATHRPHTLLHGEFLNSHQLIAVVGDDLFKFFFANNGTVKSEVDTGAFLYAKVGRYQKTDAYDQLYIQHNSIVKIFDLELDMWLSTWEVNTERIERILDMAIADTDNDGYSDVFFSQNGSYLYYYMGNKSLIWKHKHNSFLANKVFIYNDSDLGITFLVKDYHRIFALQPIDGTILAATRSQFNLVEWMHLTYEDLSVATDLFLLAGNAFYAHNFNSLSFWMVMGTNAEQTVIDISRVIKIIIPALGMMGFVLYAIVHSLKKKELKVK